MAKRSEVLVEERDYSRFYFVLSTLLTLSTLWAVIDMARFRAPWKSLQRQTNEMELASAEAELAAATEEFEFDHGEEYKELQAELKEAQATMRGPEYEAAQAEASRAERVFQDWRREFQFMKSEYDELYYEYKHAQYTGRQSLYEKLKAQTADLEAELLALKTTVDSLEAVWLTAHDKVDQFGARADSLQDMIVAMTRNQARLKRRIENIKDRSLEVKQIVLTNFQKGNFGQMLDRVDRCQTCHAVVTKRRFEDRENPFKSHPRPDELLANHPPERFGCSPCHEGQGPALQVDPAHGRVKHWLDPLLAKESVEAGCNKCHAGQFYVQHAPRLTRSKRMLFDLGCYGCHEIKGYESAEKIGPNLNRLSSKIQSPQWIYRWLSGTKRILPHGRMPDPLLSEAETEAVVAYLMDVSRRNKFETVDDAGGGAAKRGEKLFRTIGCNGCHVLGADDRERRNSDLPYDVAPELTNIGSKVTREWIYNWIRDPKSYNPMTRMPNLRLTHSDALDIAAFLSRQKKETTGDMPTLDDLDDPQKIAEGKAVIRNFGCHGCHEIEGMEGQNRVSVSLNSFGAKQPEELFFGDALADGRVKSKTWYDWTTGKLRFSRMYATEAIVQRMPDFGLSEDDAANLALLLRSWDGRSFGAEYTLPVSESRRAISKGQRLIRKYNCTGCHVIDGFGGDIRVTIDDQGYWPPVLDGEGAKVKYEWLFDFFRAPSTIRPWLKVRMPTFGFSDEESSVLIRYFAASAKEHFGYRSYEEVQPDRQSLTSGKKMFEMFQCEKCHVLKPTPDLAPEDLAPDLALASQRLQPEWIIDWVEDPQVIQPGTRMPTFFPDGVTYLPDILDGDVHRQVTAIRDYVLSLE